MKFRSLEFGHVNRLSRGALVAIAVIAVASPQAGLAAEPSDPASIRVYVHGRYRLARTLLSGLPAARDAVKQYVAHISQECPNVLNGAPGGQQSLEFLQEEIDAFSVVLLGTYEQQTGELSRKFKVLEHVSQKLKRTILRGVSSSLAPDFETPPIPDLCRDFEAWAASGFKTLPAATRALANSDVGEGPLAEAREPSKPQNTLEDPNRAAWIKLAPYESASLRKLAHVTRRLEGTFGVGLVATLLSASTELAKLLGMKAEGPGPHATGKVVAPTTSG